MSHVIVKMQEQYAQQNVSFLTGYGKRSSETLTWESGISISTEMMQQKSIDSKTVYGKLE